MNSNTNKITVALENGDEKVIDGRWLHEDASCSGSCVFEPNDPKDTYLVSLYFGYGNL
jgi:hypothetical protein